MMKLSTQDWEALRRFKPTAEAFAGIGPLLDTLGEFNSLEQAFNQTQARLDDKREEEKQVELRLKACNEKESDAALLLVGAGAKADEIIANANKEADGIRKDAEEDVKAVLERAKDDAKRLRDLAKKDVADSEKLINESNAKLLEITNLVDSKQNELGQLNEDLEAAKHHFAVLLRGKI